MNMGILYCWLLRKMETKDWLSLLCDMVQTSIIKMLSMHDIVEIYFHNHLCYQIVCLCSMHQQHKGNTCIHFAFAFNYHELGEYIISKGGNDSIKNILGLTGREGIGTKSQTDASVPLKSKPTTKIKDNNATDAIEEQLEKKLSINAPTN